MVLTEMNRDLLVSCHSTVSLFRESSHGVSQGSFTGPVLHRHDCLSTVGFIFNLFEVLHVMHMYDMPYIAII
jgi:hypothetical protein